MSSPYLNDLLPEAVPTHKEWVGFTVDVVRRGLQHGQGEEGGAAEELPGPARSQVEGPARQSKPTIRDGSAHSPRTLRHNGEKETHKLFSDIVAKNGLSVAQGPFAARESESHPAKWRSR
jgi:iron(III) transport system substrate-binding protein